jgi:hypothetical protein
MADDHFRQIELHLPFKEFLRIPRNSAYKYEYFDGRAVLSPRPKCYHAVLDLKPLASTFLLGNDSSTLWHWRNGFRLQPLYSAMRRAFATCQTRQ